jgi:RNA polymerase sigma factor (sigma-70 family)
MKRPDVSQARENAFRALYEHNYPFILRYVRRRLDDRTSSDLDVVSETFAVAWRRLDDVPATPDDLPWLYAVARNVLLRQQRQGMQHRRLQIRLDSEPKAASEPLGVDAETRATVRHAIESLNEIDREIVKLSFWEAMTHAQIGAVLNLSANAVELRLRRARLRLHETLAVSSLSLGESADQPYLRVPPTHETSEDL